MSVFLMAFMMKVSLSDSPRDFIVYCIVRYALMGIFSCLLVNLFKKHPLFAWRISMVFSLLEIMMVIFFSRWPGFIYVTALFSGLESILYWRPKIFFDTSEISDDRRVAYKSTGQILIECVKIIMPVVLGFIIDGNGYERAALFILAISVMQLILSFFFRPRKKSKKEVEQHSIQTSVRQCFKRGSVQKLMYIQLLRGLFTASAAYVVVGTLSLNRAVADNNTLRGVITASASLVAIILLAFYRRMAGKFIAQRIMLVALMPAVVLMPLVTFIYPDNTTIAFAFYIFMAAIVASLIDSTVGVVRMQDILSRHLDNEDDRVVVEVIGEVFLSIGRVISLGILLVVAIFGNYQTMLIWAFLSSFAMLPFIKIAIPSSSKKIRRYK